MMKIYTVVYEYGEYSDKGWSLMGNFSSEEKAREFISKSCEKVDPESKREEWEKSVKTNRERVYQQFQIQEVEHRLAIKNAQDERSERIHRDPNYNQGKIARLNFSLDRIVKAIAAGPAEIYQPDLETYMRLNYGRPETSDMDIIETELDEEIK
jgi:hypothetical protein